MPARLRQLAPGVARLSAFVLLVSAAVHLLAGRVVRAKAEEALLDLGGGLAQLEATTGAGGERVLELNGTRVRFAVDTRDEAVAAVLDAAQAHCAPGGRRVLRGGGGWRGFVACAAPPPVAGPVVGEVRPAGGVHRYLYAQRADRGTLAVSVAVDGSIDLADLFPAEGDAPGVDPSGVPRPPRARRLLSARELGAPQQIAMYLAPDDDAAGLEAWYRARLSALGWRPLDGDRPAGGRRVLLAERAGILAALVFADDAGAGGASVVVLTSLDDPEEGT